MFVLIELPRRLRNMLSSPVDHLLRCWYWPDERQFGTSRSANGTRLGESPRHAGRDIGRALDGIETDALNGGIPEKNPMFSRRPGVQRPYGSTRRERRTS